MKCNNCEFENVCGTEFCGNSLIKIKNSKLLVMNNYQFCDF